MPTQDSLLFSIIVPVYNRPDEVAELIESLEAQTDRGFQLVLVEDGSTIPSLPDTFLQEESIPASPEPSQCSVSDQRECIPASPQPSRCSVSDQRERIPASPQPSRCSVSDQRECIPASPQPTRCSVSDHRERPDFLKYYRKSNEGRSIARNYGMERADGDFFVFVDSDCILPPDYIANLRAALSPKKEADLSPAPLSPQEQVRLSSGETTDCPLSPQEQVRLSSGETTDCFGGPDAAHDSFSDTQKAINFAMTSFLTTGGIRGGKVSMEKFTPRTFNMGFSRRVYDRVGGFREMFSEDIDMSTRIRNAGFRIALFPEVFVYHKRRGNLRKFWRQVHVFGMSRITLQLLYPGSMKLVHWLPAIFTLGLVGLIIGSCFWPCLLILLGIYVVALFISALFTLRNFKIACLAVAASFVQLLGYGTGFIKAYFTKIILRRGRDINEEIEIRKGKNEAL